MSERARNPARVYLPCVSRVVGELGTECHAALRSLAGDFLAEAKLTPVTERQAGAIVEPWLVRRATSACYPVTTGLDLVEADNPRRLYQTFYAGVGDVLGQPASLAAEATVTDWLAKSTVEQTAVNRFVVTPAHESSPTIELEFQLPGSGQPIRADATPRGGTRLQTRVVRPACDGFAGGVAASEHTQVADLAASLGLPDAFVNWSELCGDFGRSPHRTSNRMRAAIASIADAAKKALRTQADALHFLFGDLSLRSRESRGAAEATAIVIGWSAWRTGLCG